MGCCNEPATALASAEPDPSRHVSFARGMVLGVDDFQQEFAYLAGRAHWLAREAVGYGTASGLRVFVEDSGAEGPRLHVTGGTALVPGGRLVCVGTEQCATLNRWLAKRENGALVTALLHPASPPDPPSGSGRIALYLTLCHAECATRPVPIPGEPCRPADELMAPSRVADDFRLELRGEPPAQAEEDALREFVRWLRAGIRVVEPTSPPSGDDASWLQALRTAAAPWLGEPAPPPPPEVPPLPDPAPPGVEVARDRVCDFLRAALRFWVTELRPRWMARRCHAAAWPDRECVLLARVDVDVVWSGGSPAGAWQVADTPGAVAVDERGRPLLVHLRLLQEWMASLHGDTRDGPHAASVRPPAGGMRVAVSSVLDGQRLEPEEQVALCGALVNSVRLPRAGPSTAGRVHVVKCTDGRAVTVSAEAGDTIDGNATVSVKKGNALTLVSDGAGKWFVIATVA